MLGVDLVGSSRISLLTLDGPSIQTALEGSRRIVWMIIGMIKAHPTEPRMRSREGNRREAARVELPTSGRGIGGL
jgi:hypothetical protein